MNLPQGSGLTFFMTGIVVFLCFKSLEGGFGPNQGKNAQSNFTTKSILLAIASFVAAVLVIGPISGVAIVLGIAIHEFGHVAAFRSIGHNDARFRLIPLLGGVAISNRLPKNQLAEFYIAIMGPGIMLAPLVVTGVYIHTIGVTNSLFDQFARAMFIITGAINFFNLLPFWPLDGGRIVRAITFGVSHKISHALTFIMSGGLIIWAILAQQYLILFVAIVGLLAARQAISLSEKQPPMTNSQAIAALAAYLIMLWAFWLAGRPLIEQLVFRSSA